MHSKIKTVIDEWWFNNRNRHKEMISETRDQKKNSDWSTREKEMEYTGGGM